MEPLAGEEDALKQTTKSSLQLLCVNMRGRMFEIDRSCLRDHATCKLNGLSVAGENYMPARGCWYFNRNPAVFEAVVDYLVTGRLHVPRCLCLGVVLAELSFWGLDAEEVMDACCWIRLQKDADDQENLDEVHDKWRAEWKSRQMENSCRMKTWRVLDDITSSKAAMVWAFVITVATCTSVCCLILETIPALRIIPDDVILQLESGNVTNHVYHTLINSGAHYVLVYTEFVANSLMTVDLMLRLIFCPSKCGFFKDIFNYLDFLAIAPYWAWVAAFFLQNPELGRPGNIFSLMSILRVLRVFRLIRLLQNFETMNTILMAVKRSKKEFLLLLTLILVACSMFASLVFYAEIYEDNFTNIPVGMWWALVTMTTVGYGDYYPVTTLGYLVGAACAVSCTLIVALPIPVIVSNFIDIYGHTASSRRLRRREIKKLNSQQELQEALTQREDSKL